jgi:hypothetical protein
MLAIFKASRPNFLPGVGLLHNPFSAPRVYNFAILIPKPIFVFLRRQTIKPSNDYVYTDSGLE